MGESGDIPPGNAPGETKWQSRVVRPKADIKLTAGKAINVPIETLVDQVVKTNKVTFEFCLCFGPWFFYLTHIAHKLPPTKPHVVRKHYEGGRCVSCRA